MSDTLYTFLYFKDHSIIIMSEYRLRMNKEREELFNSVQERLKFKSRSGLIDYLMRRALENPDLFNDEFQEAVGDELMQQKQVEDVENRKYFDDKFQLLERKIDHLEKLLSKPAAKDDFWEGM